MSMVSKEREQTCRTALTGILSARLGDQRPIKVTNGQIDLSPGSGHALELPRHDRQRLHHIAGLGSRRLCLVLAKVVLLESDRCRRRSCTVDTHQTDFDRHMTCVTYVIRRLAVRARGTGNRLFRDVIGLPKRTDRDILEGNMTALNNVMAR